jgi:glycosyltransferase involved in cell wall biosynthesis
MKLVYITNQIFRAAGLERVLSIKLNYFIKNYNYEIHLITLNQGNEKLFYDFDENIVFHDITLSRNIPKYFFDYASKIRKKITEIQPDIVLVCDDGLKAFLLPFLLPRKYPLIYERHTPKLFAFKDYNSKIKSFLVNKIMHFGGKKYTKFVVLTIENLKEWQLENASVIPNPLSFYPSQSSTLENKKAIVVGANSFHKGYDRLIEAWSIVNITNKDWKLTIFGNTFNKSFITMVNEKKLTDSIFFHEPTNDIMSQYLDSSLLILASRYEGFGMVLIEAMACGVPCVSFDCPCGPTDIIRNNEDGFLVQNGDVNELANKILTVIENESLRKQMGIDAKENVKRFLPEVICKQWDNLFKSITK